MNGSMNDVVQMSSTISSSGSLSGSISSTGELSSSVSIPKTINGANDYEKLKNRPSIEYIELLGNKNFDDLGLMPMDADDLIEILS